MLGTAVPPGKFDTIGGMYELPDAVFDVEGNLACWPCADETGRWAVIIPPTRDLGDVQRACAAHWTERGHDTETRIGRGYLVAMMGTDNKVHAHLIPEDHG